MPENIQWTIGKSLESTSRTGGYFVVRLKLKAIQLLCDQMKKDSAMLQIYHCYMSKIMNDAIKTEHGHTGMEMDHFISKKNHILWQTRQSLVKRKHYHYCVNKSVSKCVSDTTPKVI